MKKSLIKVDLTSLKSVELAMNLAISKIVFKSRRGLIAAGIHLLGEAQKNTPVEYGPLKSSGTVIWDKSQPNANDFSGPNGDREKINTKRMITEIKNILNSNVLRFDVGIGFGASYSIFVHENMTNAHPNGGTAKFLEKAMTENRTKILKIIRDNAKI